MLILADVHRPRRGSHCPHVDRRRNSNSCLPRVSRRLVQLDRSRGTIFKKHIALASHEEEIMLDGHAWLRGRFVATEQYIDEGYPVTHSDDAVVRDNLMIGQPVWLQIAMWMQTSCGAVGCDSCERRLWSLLLAHTCAACPCGLPGRFWIRVRISDLVDPKGMDIPPALVTI